jgi:hypothetical protein
MADSLDSLIEPQETKKAAGRATSGPSQRNNVPGENEL